jgi:hypothetical protein
VAATEYKRFDRGQSKPGSIRAAAFSRDTDFAIVADAANLVRLCRALDELRAIRFDTATVRPCLTRQDGELKRALMAKESVEPALLVAHERGIGETAPHHMKTAKDVRKYAAEHGVSGEEALKGTIRAKANEFAEKGAKVYAKG